jgi:hypothetical protein
MKKILSLLVLLVAFTSCEEDVKFNTPAVQSIKELWKATEFSAVKTGNALTLTAKNGFETVILKTTSVTPGEYVLGTGVANKATYALSVDGIEEFYQTGTDLGNGLITISADNTDATKGYISGFFRFNAVSDAGVTINFQEGVFYKVPIK